MTQQLAVVGKRSAGTIHARAVAGRNSSAAACRHPPSRKRTGTRRRFPRFCRLHRLISRLSRFGEASAIYEQILLRETEQPVALSNLGVIAHRTGRSELAITLLTRAIAADPRDPSFFVNLGNVYVSSGALHQAIANYRQAVSLDPELEWAHLRLGDALQQQGDLVEGAVSISRALTIKPDFPEAVRASETCFERPANRSRQSFVFAKRSRSRPAMRRSTITWETRSTSCTG